MARDLKVGLELTIKDSASATVSKALQTLAKEGREAGEAVNGLARSGKELGTVAQAPQTLSRGLQELARQGRIAEQAVGATAIRARELGRSPAPSTTIDGIRQIIRQANVATRAVKGLGVAMEHAARVGSTLASAAAGIGAGAAVISRPLNKAIGYDEQLSRLAATAGAGESQEEKARIKDRMSVMVEEARQYSGGASRDDVAASLNTLVASGKFKTDAELSDALRQSARAAFAMGGDPDDMARLAIAMKNFGGVKLSDGFDEVLKSGQVGRFEGKNMARHLPDQLGKASKAGFSGKDGFVSILTYNQTAMNTAGSADEAGNNVKNLLEKMTSREFAGGVAKAVRVRPGDPYETEGQGKKAKKVFDWSTYAQKNREKGIDAIQSFEMLLNREMQGDKRYQSLQKELKTLPEGAKRRETVEALQNMVMGSTMGKLMADMQAGSAMTGYMLDKAGWLDMNKATHDSKGAVDQDKEFLSRQTFAHKNMAAGNIDRANESTFEELASPINKVLAGFTELSNEYPKLTSAIYASTVALSGLAAAGLGVVAAKFLTGSIPAILKGGIPAAAGAVTGATAATGAATGAGTAAAAGAGGLLLPVTAAAAFGGSLAVIGSRITDEDRANGPRRMQQARFGRSFDTPLEQASASLNQVADTLRASNAQPIVVKSELHVDGRQMAESVNRFNSQTARRN
ncbi:phage tail tape measure protein [Laribacter hongkongensis]|uniref:phage tail tape measure protein n=1 Tax=Laribacter hongkongensis TaxID=168471 RepID=UPI001EFEC6E1|nr:phage tail tape measure protein [Laribacter hongkongensis]MCG9060178.1 phage tail tape measure protein [Laribacter hongkongensis]MCG9087290.1 phage tail tape measure protein [Laribacter hongkongensis]